MGDVGVTRNQALIIFANCFQIKSSYKLSRCIPSRLQWRCCVNISKQLRVAVLDISSAVILFYGTEDQKSAYADFKQLQKTGLNHSRINPLRL